jgi:PAS domain S-box-containing protein
MEAMADFFLLNLDYVYFVYGLAFITLAAALVGAEGADRSEGPRPPWKLLVVFGLLHGANEWLDLLALSLGDFPFFYTARLAVLAVSFVLLLEFGRKGVASLGGTSVGAWIYAVLIPLACLGALSGLQGLNASTRYVFGLSGGLWAGRALLLWARLKGGENPTGARGRPDKLLLLSAVSFALYGIAAGVIVPEADFFPASVLNQRSFMRATFLPIQLLRAALACGASVGLFLWQARLAAGKEAALGADRSQRALMDLRLLWIFSGLLVLGWFGTNSAGRYVQDHLDSKNTASLEMAKATFMYQTDLAERVVKTMAASSVLERLGASSPPSQEEINEVLERYSEILPESVCYVMNLEGTTIGASNHALPTSFLGRSYAFRHYFQEAKSGRLSRSVAVGQTSVLPGYYASMPVYDERRTIVAVAVVKMNIQSTPLLHFRDINAFIVDQHGLIIAASRAQHLLQPLWPIEESVKKRMLESREYPRIVSEPLLANKIGDGRFEWRGQPMRGYVTRTEAPGVSVVLLDSLHEMNFARLLGMLVTLLFCLFTVAFWVAQATSRSAALRIAASERRYRQMFENNQSVQLLIDPRTGVVVDANEAACHYYGFSRDALRGMAMSAFAAYAEFQDKEEETGRQKQEQMLPGRHRLADGGLRDVEIYAGPVEIAGKTLLYNIVHDVTARKKAEAELAHSLQFKNAVFENNSAGVFVATDTRVIIDASRRACDMFGYGKEEILQRSFELLHVSREAFLHFGREYDNLKHERFVSVEAPMRRKNGERFWCALAGSLLDPEDMSKGVIWVMLDIDQRKQAEAKLVEFAKRLEEKNQALDAAATKAEEASRAKGLFLANMSHELRTPLNGVVGMANLLLDTELTGEQRQYAEIVRNSSSALLEVISDILDLSKIEAGRFEFETIDFDLRELLEDTAEMLAVSAQQKNLELTCILAPGTPTLLRGDPGKLRQLVTNLVANAIKFTATGDVVIRATLLEQGQERAILRFEVADSGVGVPAEKIGQLFQPFSQLDASTTRKYGGAGLGLSISKHIAEHMGGEIGVRSQFGQGSTFWFTAVFELQPDRVAAKDPLVEALAGKRCLVASANANLREHLGLLLDAWSVQRDEADSLDRALDALRAIENEERRFHAVLSDIGELGLAAAEAGLGQPKLVLLAPLSLPIEERLLWSQGFVALLSKPIKQSRLRDCLAGLEGGITARREAPPEPVGLSPEARAKARILLVEDNGLNQAVALTLLRKRGYNADLAENGREALAAMAQKVYDVVLMDCQMPEMDGYEATRAMRDPASAVLRRDTPVLAMTANALRGDREKCLAAGMNDYISKPIVAQVFFSLLERWLAVGRAEASSGEPGYGAAGSSGQAPPPVFDYAGVLRRLGDASLVQDVICEALLQLPERIQILRNHGLAGQDAQPGPYSNKELARMAHSLKSIAATVGAEQVSLCAERVERAVFSHAPSEFMTGLDDLQRALDLFALAVSDSGVCLAPSI